MNIRVDKDVCTGCETCVTSCPYDSIIMEDGFAFINEYCQLCRACLSICPEGAIKEEGSGAGTSSESVDLDRYRGVLIFAEQRKGTLSHVSMELLGAGRRLANKLNTTLHAALLGADNNEAEELVRWGADKVFLCNDSLVRDFNDEPYTDLLSRIIDSNKPEIVLAGATAIGRSFLPRVAVRLRAGLTADCTSLEIEEGTRNLMQVRPAFGGNIMATIVCPDRRPQMATVRPRVMKKGEYDKNRKGEIVDIPLQAKTFKTSVIENIGDVSECGPGLQEAEIIVAGGRGMGGPKGYAMLKELSEAINGTVGASRAAVDEGWIPYSQQVGQTGKTVCPKIYIACGISGAVQHLVGMQSSDMIIAINKNPDAPIFNISNYGIVGDIHEIVPLLIRRIEEERSRK